MGLTGLEADVVQDSETGSVLEETIFRESQVCLRMTSKVEAEAVVLVERKGQRNWGRGIGTQSSSNGWSQFVSRGRWRST